MRLEPEGRSRKTASDCQLEEDVESRDSKRRMESNSLVIDNGRRPLSLSVFKPVSSQLIEQQDTFATSIYPRLWSKNEYD